MFYFAHLAASAEAAQQQRGGSTASAARCWHQEQDVSVGRVAEAAQQRHVSSGEAGLQSGSNGGGKALAFICTSFAVYEFIFLPMFQ